MRSSCAIPEVLRYLFYHSSRPELLLSLIYILRFYKLYSNTNLPLNTFGDMIDLVKLTCHRVILWQHQLSFYMTFEVLSIYISSGFFFSLNKLWRSYVVKDVDFQVRMVTEDDVLTAQAIAKDCGILENLDGLDTMTGAQFRVLSDLDRKQSAPNISV